MKEPQIHSHITDVLPRTHPLAEQQVTCAKCKDLVHAFNNECMQTWVETGRGNFCVRCFGTRKWASTLCDSDGLAEDAP